MLLRRRKTSEQQKEETLDGRDGVALACHLRALSWLARVAHRSREDSLLDAILLLGNEHLEVGRKRPHQP